jgi:hypothetical protein
MELVTLRGCCEGHENERGAAGGSEASCRGMAERAAAQAAF